MAGLVIYTGMDIKRDEMDINHNNQLISWESSSTFNQRNKYNNNMYPQILCEYLM